jgi:uncharacterized membrane protein
MSEAPETPMEPEATSDDKLWALLAYIFTPIVPIIILLMEDKKNRPFIRAHNAQALAVGVINVILGVVLSWTLVLACVPLIIWFVCIYWGVQAYNGKMVQIPVVTDFVKNQGWA